MMLDWKVQTAILCSYGFIKGFRPIEPFLTAFQTSNDYKNFTEDQVDSEIYPVWTYTYLAALVPVFVLTDLVRHKPVLVLESVSFVSAWVLLIWGTTVLSQQLVEVAYGFATATEVAYYAYIYAVVDKDKYQRATSFVRSANQAGKAFSYGISQLVISTGIGSFYTLNYISLGSTIVIFFIAIGLPGVPKDKLPKEGDSNSGLTMYLKNLWPSAVEAYSNLFVLKWSVWWALATACFLQILNYEQALWVHNDPDQKNLYNGLTEFVCTTLAFIAVALTQFLKVRWEKWGEVVIGTISLIECTVLLISSSATNVFIAYVCYGVFKVVYQVLITIASFNVAKSLKSDSFGLIFGLNTFLALALQSIITIVAADKRGLHLGIRAQFVVYGSYYGVLGVVFVIAGLHTLSRWSNTGELNLIDD